SALREGVELRVVVLDAYQGLLTGGPRGPQRVDISLREIMKLYGSIPIAIEVDARSRRKVDDVRVLTPGDAGNWQHSVLRAVISANPLSRRRRCLAAPGQCDTDWRVRRIADHGRAAGHI